MMKELSSRRCEITDPGYLGYHEVNGWQGWGSAWGWLSSLSVLYPQGFPKQRLDTFRCFKVNTVVVADFLGNFTSGVSSEL